MTICKYANWESTLSCDNPVLMIFHIYSKNIIGVDVWHIKNNNDIQTITNIISKKYSVNKDRIHDYTNRLKKKIGSTTIESIT